MSETQIIQQSETLALIAASHGRDAIETIARIMKTSDSDKLRLVAAKMMLDEIRAGCAVETGDAAAHTPRLGSGKDAEEILSHLRAKGGAHAAPSIALATGIHVNLVAATLVQMRKSGAVVLHGPGMYKAAA